MAQFLPPNAQAPSAGGASRANVDEGLRSYMLRVYNYMGLGVAFTAVVTLFLMTNPDIMRAVATGPMKWVLFGGIFALGLFSHKVIYGGNTFLAHGAYWLYCAMWGALLSPMVYLFFAKGAGGLVFKALALTAVTFGATSLLGYTTKRDMTGWGGFLSMATIGLLVVSLGSFFFITDPGTSKTVSLIISCVVVLLFAAMTAWETQQIKDMYLNAESYGGGENFVARSAIFGAFMLYGSFVTMFTHILNILGITSSD